MRDARAVVVLLRGRLVVVVMVSGWGCIVRCRRRVEGHGEDVRTEQRGATAVLDDVARIDLAAGRVGHGRGRRIRAPGRIGLGIEGTVQPLDSRRWSSHE